jgi:integrase
MADLDSKTDILAPAIQPSMTLLAAGPIWLEAKRPYVCERTLRDYGEYLKRLREMFASIRLEQITIDAIRNYQLARRMKAGPSRTNQETNVLSQILRHAGLWSRLEPNYKPFPLSVEKKGRALSEEEEYRLFTIGALNPNWAVCYNVALLSAHTACGPGEIRHLRLKDVSLGDEGKNGWIRIREESAKNQYRMRTIPLDRQALQAVEALLRIAKERGSHAENHYLIPFRPKKGTYDPTRCVTAFKTAWTEMTAAADLEGLRMYDLRHHALTRLAEKVPEQVVLKIAGHVSQQMLRKVYAHVRDNAVTDAINCLSREDGWKPSDKTMKLLRPTRKGKHALTFESVQAVKTQAERIIAESEDDSWLRLSGEEQ